MEIVHARYNLLRTELIAKYMKDGMDKKSAEKKANEDARFVLPNACETKIIVTMNIRSLFNFFKHRCCNRAQWEIRDLAWRMLELVRPTAPYIFADAGPGCVRGACPEGKMTCGNPYPRKERD